MRWWWLLNGSNARHTGIWECEKKINNKIKLVGEKCRFSKHNSASSTCTFNNDLTQTVLTLTVNQLRKGYPWAISDQDYLPLCTSSGCILQLCKVSSVSVHPLGGSSAQRTGGLTDRWIGAIPINIAC